MRDGEIFRMNQQRANNEVRLYRQFVFLDTRFQAIENETNSVWKVIRALFNPVGFWKRVDESHGKLIASHDEQMKQAAKEAEEAKKKPKITLLGTMNTNGRG